MRAQAYLRGVPLPPKHSVQDAYLQLVMQRDNERRYDELNAIISAVWATVPSETQKSFIETTADLVKSVFTSLFPFAPKASTQTAGDKEQRSAAMLKKLQDGKLFKLQITDED